MKSFGSGPLDVNEFPKTVAIEITKSAIDMYTTELMSKALTLPVHGCLKSFDSSESCNNRRTSHNRERARNVQGNLHCILLRSCKRHCLLRKLGGDKGLRFGVGKL